MSNIVTDVFFQTPNTPKLVFGPRCGELTTLKVKGKGKGTVSR